MKYAFGGDTALSPEAIKRRRAIAEAMRGQQRAPRNVGEGIHSFARSITGALMDRRADKMEKARQDQFQERLAALPEGQRNKVAAAMLSGANSYAFGTRRSRPGMAVVGELGPEVVHLPQGAQITPVSDPRALRGDGEGFMEPPRADAMREQVPGYREMNREQRLDYLNNPANGFVPIPPDDADLYGGGGVRGLRGAGGGDSLPDANGALGNQQPAIGVPLQHASPPGASFVGGNYRTADLDAFKMMQADPEYGAPAEADLNSSEASRVALLRRAMFADAALEDPRLARAMTRWDNNIAGGMGALGRLYTDDNYELGRLMAEGFANAVLRLDSGAQAPEAEVQRYARQFFPQSNDTDEQLRAKKALRRETLRAMQQALGGDASPAVEQIMEEIESLRQYADVPDGSLTGDAQQAPQPAGNAAPDENGWVTINGVRVRAKQ